jgi:hypothetical protein
MSKMPEIAVERSLVQRLDITGPWDFKFHSFGIHKPERLLKTVTI